eukprot:gene14244-18865_t
MAPTRIYVRSLLPLVREKRLKGLAHITGGGLLENIPRVLPKGAHAMIDAGAWPQPRLGCAEFHDTLPPPARSKWPTCTELKSREGRGLGRGAQEGGVAHHRHQLRAHVEEGLRPLGRLRVDRDRLPDRRRPRHDVADRLVDLGRERIDPYYQFQNGVKTYISKSLVFNKHVVIQQASVNAATYLNFIQVIIDKFNTGELPLDGSGIYTIFFRGNIAKTPTLIINGVQKSWLTDWCGYHGAFRLRGINTVFKFAVVGDPTSSSDPNLRPK